MGHTASLSQLQNPGVASVDGEITPYEDVRIHVSAEALTRALSVFEGLKAYWNDESDELALRWPDRHYARLRRTCALLHIPVHFALDEYIAWMNELAGHLATPERDIWFRTTMYVTEGHWGEGTRAQLVITAFTQSKEHAPPYRIGVSSWRRPADVSMPARIKSAAGYQVARVARIEANRHGYDDAVLLNASGRVAEGTSSCVVCVRDGTVLTPPASEGALESLTIDAVETVCNESGIRFERRPLERSELLVADEIALVGTITEISHVSEIDGVEKPVDGVLASVRRSYGDALRRRTKLPGLSFSTITASRLDAIRLGS
jgi:branched-chain amino acid aminotransferase